MSDIDVKPLPAQAVENVQRDYPSPLDPDHRGSGWPLAAPRATPDVRGFWHSHVHQTWLIAQLLRTRPGLAGEPEAVAVLDRLLTAEHGQTEARFFSRPHNAHWERPCGWACC